MGKLAMMGRGDEVRYRYVPLGTPRVRVTREKGVRERRCASVPWGRVGGARTAFIARKEHTNENSQTNYLGTD